ncbi:MAG: HPr family phosphocarrier protein [Candidatus Omnitrophica bacterium]|nr:HPr family phosphocarrier protein [Candidatus Omnitrophota bacterium]
MPHLEKEIVVKSHQGLHARPAALLVQIAVKYDSSLMIKKDEECVNGKSIMGILMLGIQANTSIVVITEGEDAEALMAEVEAFLSKDE